MQEQPALSRSNPSPGAAQINVELLLQIIGELFVENYARKRGMVTNASESIQASNGGIREDQSAPSENHKMPYESMSAKVSRQNIER